MTGSGATPGVVEEIRVGLLEAQHTARPHLWAGLASRFYTWTCKGHLTDVARHFEPHGAHVFV